MAESFTSGLQHALRSRWLHPLNDAQALNDLAMQAGFLWSPDRVKARVVAIVDESADTKTFVLRPNHHWNAPRAGQHVSVEVEVAGVRLQRCYSLSSNPGACEIAITVKRQPGGKVSNALHDRVTAGDLLNLSAARGEFVLPELVNAPLLLVAGGSGITPIMAMLRALAERTHAGDVTLIFSCRTTDDVIFAHELQTLTAVLPGLLLHLHYTSENGRLSGDNIASIAPDYAQRMTFLCGPQGLMDTVQTYWRERGLAARLRCEHFTAAGLRSVALDGAPVQIACARSERSFATTGAAPLLIEAEAAGLAPKYGCRIGICHSCKCRKKTGTVQNLLTGALSSEPDELIQLCISAARSDVTLDL